MANQQCGIGSQLIRRIASYIAILAEQIHGKLTRIQHDSSLHGSDIMQAELQRRDDPEVAAAAANRPEQILILFRAHGQMMTRLRLQDRPISRYRNSVRASPLTSQFHRPA